LLIYAATGKVKHYAEQSEKVGKGSQPVLWNPRFFGPDGVEAVIFG